jgi:hypothetical protein
VRVLPHLDGDDFDLFGASSASFATCSAGVGNCHDAAGMTRGGQEVNEKKEQEESDAFWDEHGVAIGFALPPATEMGDDMEMGGSRSTSRDGGGCADGVVMPHRQSSSRRVGAGYTSQPRVDPFDTTAVIADEHPPQRTTFLFNTTD